MLDRNGRTLPIMECYWRIWQGHALGSHATMMVSTLEAK
jgi:hypothetical protein